MLVLGLDTATPSCSVALIEHGRLLAELTVVSPRAHSARLMPLIAQALQEAGREKGDLAAIACGVGPGSFTGLRIGITTAKTLAYALGLPCLPVSTLAAMAHGLGPGLVSPVLDARRGEVFAALYRDGQEVAAPQLVPLAGWLAELDRLGEPVTLAGDGAGLFLAEAGQRLGARARFAPAGQVWPRGWAVADLGAAALAAGRTVAPADLLPVYLRRSAPEEQLDTPAVGGG